MKVIFIYISQKIGLFEFQEEMEPRLKNTTSQGSETWETGPKTSNGIFWGRWKSMRRPTNRGKNTICGTLTQQLNTTHPKPAPKHAEKEKEPGKVRS
jgi:hypothetical protein